MDVQKECDEIVELLEQDDLEEALNRARAVCRQHPEDPRALYVLASSWRAAGDPVRCREVSARALASVDSSHPDLPFLREPFQVLLGWSAWQNWDFPEAERLLRQALDAHPEDAEAWDLLSAVLEHSGRREEAEQACAMAAELDPESFPVPPSLSDEQIGQAVERALDELPEVVYQVVRDIPIVIQDFPTREMASPVGDDETPLGPDTLGLFVGTSRLEQSYLSALDRPGTIFLFKRNLERMCPDQATLEEEVNLTIHHELAHFAGFEEDQMPGLGLE